jgi:hypothetical protein
VSVERGRKKFTIAMIERTYSIADYADSVARRALLDLALPSGGNDVVVALKGQRQ